MKAYVLHGIGDLRYEEHPIPKLSSGWALVRVSAAGICSSDIPRVFQKGTYHFPTIPGHEFCGRVEAVYEKTDAVWLGKRVGVFPLIPCRQCESCRMGRYETCSQYDYIGSRRDGGFAEYTAVPVWNLIELTDRIDDIQGALLEPAAVALHAVRRANLCKKKSVCVVGTGPIGLLAGQWAGIQGVGQVFMRGRSEAKRQIAQQCGLNYLIDDPDRRFDCVIEAVGNAEALETSLHLAAPGGTVILMGNPDGDIVFSQTQYWSILRKQLTLAGTWNSSYGEVQSDWERTIQAMADGVLHTSPIVSHVLEKGQLDVGLSIMRDKLEPCCKIVAKF